MQQLAPGAGKRPADILYPQHVAYCEKLPRIRQRGALLPFGHGLIRHAEAQLIQRGGKLRLIHPFFAAALRNERAYIRIHAVLFPPPVRPFLIIISY